MISPSRSHFPFDAVTVAALAFVAGAGCHHHRRGSEPVGPEAGPLSLGSAAAMIVDAAPAALAPPSVLRVPFTKVPLVPSGHFDVGVWGHAVNTHTLLDEHGRGAVPVSEARFLWGAGKLYVFFYAADVDLQVRTTKHDGPVWKDDGVVLEFASADARKFVIDVSATGVVADGTCPEDASDLGDPRCDLRWESRVRVGTDFDGTINTLGDFDEEWAVELAIPLASIRVEPPYAGAQIPFSALRCEVTYGGKRACGSWGRSRDPLRSRASGMLVLAPAET